MVAQGPLLQTVTVSNERGLHARASAKFCALAQSYDAIITVSFDGEEVGGTSIMGLLTLGAAQGSRLLLKAEGPQAREAMDSLVKLVEYRFGEKC